MKTVLIEFWDSSIYQLYNQKKNEIIISSNILFNKNFIFNSLEKIDDTIVRNTESIKFSMKTLFNSTVTLNAIIKNKVFKIDDLTFKLLLKIMISTSDSLLVKVVSKTSVSVKLKKFCNHSKKVTLLINLIIKQA